MVQEVAGTPSYLLMVALNNSPTTPRRYNFIWHVEGRGWGGHEEGIKGVDLGTGTGTNEVLKPNRYIVAGLF